MELADSVSELGGLRQAGVRGVLIVLCGLDERIRSFRSSSDAY